MDDEYNVVGTFDDGILTYPNDDDVRGDEGNEALTALNEINGKRVKRMREELENAPPDNIFVHPIDWHMKMSCGLEEREAKRSKMAHDEEVLDRLTLRILETRRRRQVERNGEKMEEEENEAEGSESALILDGPPMDGSGWMGVSSDESEQRFYFRMKRSRVKRDKATCENEMNRVIALANTSIEKIVQDAAIIRENRILMEDTTDTLERIDGAIEMGGKDGLWVNKYAPVKFTDLLSPDLINRQVMRWLKLWDECVFGRPVSMDTTCEDEKEATLFGLDEGHPKRPIHKILVLSGPAGLGKTTLAGIAARLAGYSVVELNASDSRNVGDMEKVVEGAIRSVRCLDNRPNCLVLDEIDGAPVETITWIVKTLSSSGRKMIRRPIIAICNNLYTPALRELRPIALNIQMGQKKNSRIVERLREIAMKEGSRVDLAGIETLARLCGGDIRLSLNILQWIGTASKWNGSVVRVEEVEKAVERSCLPSMNVFNNWSTVLDLSRHVESRGGVLAIGERLKRIERIIEDEDMERFITALHHNYTHIPNLSTNVLCGSSKVFSILDIFSSIINRTKRYSLYRYLPSCIMSLHLNIATTTKAILQFPSALQAISLRQRQCEETVSVIRQSLPCQQSSSHLVLDCLPFLLSILQPPIKTINWSLLSKHEELLISRVVSLLRYFGLTFIPMTVEGVSQYTFSPPIDVLCMYSLQTSTHRTMLPNAIRKKIGHEVLLTSVRHTHTEEVKGKVSVKDDSSIPSTTRNPSVLPSLSSLKHSTAPLHFKYNNCFSNAVKRKVRITQLVI